jgi:hypothetical protein
VSRVPLGIVIDQHVGMEVSPDRECGECTECCCAVSVEELKKPNWTRCEHEGRGGCAIYSCRPNSCRIYCCLWRSALLDGDENRPDRLGVILDFRYVGATQAIAAWEARPGALDTPEIIDLLDALKRRFRMLFLTKRSGSNSWEWK